MLMKNIRKYKRELAKQKRLVEKEWDFMPATYFLPSEYIMFVEEFKKREGLWIMKPTGRCQGSGIFLVDKLSQVAPYKSKAPVNANGNENRSLNQAKAGKKIEKPMPVQNEEDNSDSDEEEVK